MQFAIIVQFRHPYELDAEAVRREVEQITGESIRAEVHFPSKTIRGVELTFDRMGESVYLQFEADSSRVILEVDPDPSYFAYASALALVRLGGVTSWKIPASASKRFSEFKRR